MPAKIEKPKRYIEYERSDSDRTNRIYLTFDDGPYKTTPSLTVLLKKKRSGLTFLLLDRRSTIRKNMIAFLKPRYSTTPLRCITTPIHMR